MEGDNEADQGLDGLNEEQLELVSLFVHILRAQEGYHNVQELALGVIQFADFFMQYPLFVRQLEIIAGISEDGGVSDGQTYKAA